VIGHQQIIMKSSKSKRAPLTHFLCIPLITANSRPQLQKSLECFKARVGASSSNIHRNEADDDNTVTIPESAIRPVDSLHLTVGVMSLDGQKIDAAVSLLRTLTLDLLLRDAPHEHGSAEAATEPGDAIKQSKTSSTTRRVDPIVVDLTGLASMHDPRNTSVLYCAPNDTTSRLQCLALSAQRAFRDSGFLIADDRPLKLHATIVNTIYVKGKTREPKATRAARPMSIGQTNPFASTTEPFGPAQTADLGQGRHTNDSGKLDARGILEKFNDFVWAKDVVVDRLAICEMGVKKIYDDQGIIVREEYAEVAAVSLLPR
jgi:activating signal cointegrator complex subunit 1